MKGNDGKELSKLYDVCKQHIRAIELSEYFNLNLHIPHHCDGNGDGRSDEVGMDGVHAAITHKQRHNIPGG